MILDWIQQHGSPVDVIEVVMGVGVFFAGSYFLRRQNGQNERLWAENKELRYQLNQIDKLVFTLCVLHKRDGLDLIKESANSAGDFGLNRDVE